MDTKEVELNLKTKNKILSGTTWALIYIIISFLAGLGMRQDGDFSGADEAFIGSIIAFVGVFLYQIRKKHNHGSYFMGSRILEGLLFGILLIFLYISFTNPLGNWYESPLVWTVTPIWGLAAYLILWFKKQRTENL